MSVDEIEFEPTEAEIRWLHGENGRAPDSWRPRSLADVSDEPPEPPILGGLNLVYHGKRHLFSGPQESAKTLAAYVVGLSVVREGGRVMLIDFEMGDRDAKRRLRELGATDDELRMFDYIEPEVPLTEARAPELVALEPQLVIIDASAGAYDLQGLDDNKRQDVERFASLYIRPFWRSKIATLTIDHVVKNVEARGNYAIGSERKAGGTDVHLGFTVLSPIKRGTSGKYQITTHKDRGGFHKRGKLATFELTSDPDTHHFTWSFVATPVTDEEHPFRPTHLMEKVSRFVAMQSEPITQRRIREEKFGKTEYVAEAIKILASEGYLTLTELPNKTLIEHVRLYLEIEDRSGSLSGSQWFPESAETSGSLVPTPIGGEPEEPFVVPGTTQEEIDDGIPF